MAPVLDSETYNGEGTKAISGARTAAAQEELKARLSRKRTKSGCLTCRKRRIKCGEERPVCRNCIKSKRHCEGYNQRVVFKQPFYDFRQGPNGAAHITFQAGTVPGPVSAYYTDFSQGAQTEHPHAQLQPRPVEQFIPAAGQAHQPSARTYQPAQSVSHGSFSGPTNGGLPVSRPIAPPIQQQPLPPAIPLHQPYRPTVASRPSFQTSDHSLPEQASNGGDGSWNGSYGELSPHTLVNSNATGLLTPASSNAPGPAQQPLYWGPSPTAVQRRHEGVDTKPVVRTHGSQGVPLVPLEHRPQTWTTAAYVPQPELSRPIDYHVPLSATSWDYTDPHISSTSFVQPNKPITPEYYEHESHIPASDSPTQLLQQAAVEVHDDDYYDVYSDEEMDIDTPIRTEHDRQLTFSRILQGNHITIQDIQTRRYDTFLHGGMLDKYQPDEHANPLNNAATARVFAHFISVTGPTLSIFERHPRNTSVLFTTGQVPFSQQGLWTYTMPLAALRHRGLLHSMLALGSLHIARITGAPITSSLLHYAWALKRVHDCVAHPKKRLKATTIAASMLLGFYEVMTADHMKWNMHLAGSKQLIVETDFVGMMAQFQQMRVEKAAQDSRARHRRSSSIGGFTRDDLLEQIPELDENVISDIVGRQVRYGDHGHVMTLHSTVPPALDLSKFELLKDLYWWYCKQDAYQSIISGNALLMDYSRWANCPPRAPLGRLDAVYGSFDHLILLLGRIADFASRDRARKLRQMDLNGAQWRPAPGMQMPRPPQSAQPPVTPVSASGTVPTPVYTPLPQQTNHPPLQPAFFGMAPPPNPNVQMPTAYQPIHGMPTPQSAVSHEPIDIQVATNAALEEYGRIRSALLTFAARLGHSFEPLSSEYQPPMDTPFGPAVFYRSYDIGCLWAVYNMTMIVALRSHPHMPPAAHMAAGIAAPQTMPYALAVGRIVAGIVPGPPDQPLNPSLGAALCESCVPSFFAAVQYHDPRQRYETVMRIFSIAQRTGWGTAEVIANGCETSWVKAAAAGRGPPYERVVRVQNSADPRLNGRWESADFNGLPDEKDETDRRHVRTRTQARLNWAIGVMGLEEDEGMT